MSSQSKAWRRQTEKLEKQRLKELSAKYGELALIKGHLLVPGDLTLLNHYPAYGQNQGWIMAVTISNSAFLSTPSFALFLGGQEFLFEGEIHSLRYDFGFSQCDQKFLVLR